MHIFKPRYSATLCSPQFVAVCRGWKYIGILSIFFVHRLRRTLSEGSAISGGFILGVACLQTGSVCVQSTFSCLGTYESITYECLQQRNMICVLLTGDGICWHVRNGIRRVFVKRNRVCWNIQCERTRRSVAICCCPISKLPIVITAPCPKVASVVYGETKCVAGAGAACNYLRYCFSV